MSFFTSLTGLRAANTELAVTSNNIANAGTTGFKKSKASFGDIFAKSPLQTQTVGQGVALKTIKQEFSQGSIEFSSNTLDLAITGDGFFPLESADGQTRVFSRSGAFILNETGNVVNRSGQRLLASMVDGSGKAIGGELQTVTLSPQTVGEASATTEIDLSINLPSSAEVIDLPFDPDNPASYNKSSVIDLYDAGGNAYPATIYYVKTASADAANVGGSTYNPGVNQTTNKWQTYTLIEGVNLQPALQQAVSEKGEPLFVNQYGEIRAENEIADELVLGKSPKFTLDNLVDVKPSLPASSSGGEVPFDLGVAQGFNFFRDLQEAEGTFDLASLENFFSLDVDNSGNPVTVNLSELAQEDREISGAEIARLMENQLNEAFGDSRYFDLTTPSDRQFSVNYKLGEDELVADIDLEVVFPDAIAQSSATTDQLVGAIQADLDAALGADVLTVAYDPVNRNFSYSPTFVGAEVTLEAGPTGTNELFGLSTIPKALNNDLVDGTGFNVIPNGAFIRPEEEQRYGIDVVFNAVTNNFEISSGTTGDSSSLTLNFDVGAGFNESAATFLGYPATAADPSLTVVQSDVALRGLESTPAVTFGSPMSLNVEEVFAVTSFNNRVNVTVNGISGNIELPEGANYTIDTFTEELARQINQLADESGKTVSGVSVEYDNETKALVFTTGTTGNKSFIKVSGDGIWGLANTTPGRGTTTSWIDPRQSVETIDGAPFSIFIDEFGNETTDPTGFTELPAWSPVYLDKGELTFDKQGNLISPTGGLQMETAFLLGGGSLDLSLDFSGTTQFNQAFNVKYQKQDGLPEGDLVGLDIGDDGLIIASYSNGTQLSVGKILLANFPSADGLSARGDSAFLATAKSGVPLFGEPGSSAFGSIRAGALERSNVDLTSELIGLITAQRNFQANAKAIETSSTLTSTILNI